jgi:putative transposase
VWAKENLDPNFAWQEGYAAFTVGIRGLGNVSGYISTQEEHHKGITYLDELRAFLDEAGIPYEERFLV